MPVYFKRFQILPLHLYRVMLLGSEIRGFGRLILCSFFFHPLFFWEKSAFDENVRLTTVEIKITAQTNRNIRKGTKTKGLKTKYEERRISAREGQSTQR